MQGGVGDALSLAWQRRVSESKLRLFVQDDLVIIKEMETRYHSRAASSFSNAVLDALLHQCIPDTTWEDLPLEVDGTGRKCTS